MDETQFLGYLVLAIITLGGFVGVVQKITQPINDLRLVVQELKVCINSLRDDNATQTRRLNSHSEKIDELSKRVGKLETKMDLYHKGA